ncbi:MAG: hypothetical protein OXG92_09640 [Chloroflexi bacterium]|nr:hypothetical protein [Chloroflexota bacterium]MCY3581299.1 hypothetical protein [Chloroflexota bacterium]MCY3716711.1 hypothetical protein [Chloroflexota bacterium]MDE2649341.1 hypothetical protein [Chloroflexota bacterium]MXX49682.1 hypothetical protein [Chloroflexota bacterium]
MPGQQDDDRYQDILERIAARRPFGSPRPQKKPARPHDQALNLLNAFDTWSDLALREYARILCHGPKTVRGAAWSGVVIWYHNKGYHGYQLLRILGVWAQSAGSELVVSAGIRELPYRAPLFDPGAFRHHIASDFHLYYQDKGGPPSESDHVLLRVNFLAKQRLQLRERLQKIADQWREQQG